MKLTRDDMERLSSWKEGQCCSRDESRPHDTEHMSPMLPKVAFGIVARHAHKAKTTRGKLRRCIRACRLVIDYLEALRS